MSYILFHQSITLKIFNNNNRKKLQIFKVENNSLLFAINFII